MNQAVCDWCEHTNVGPLTRMWDDMVCAGCEARFVEEMAPEEFLSPPVANCTILKSLLEPKAEYSIGEDVAGGYVFVWGYDSPSNSYFVRCHVCRNPGPSAPSIAEAKAEALKEEFVVFNGELVCRICHVGGTTC